MSRRRELAGLHQRALAPPFGSHLPPFGSHLPPPRNYWFWRAAFLALFLHLLLWVDLEPISEHKHASDRCQGNPLKTPIALQLAAILLGYGVAGAPQQLREAPYLPSTSPRRSLSHSDYKGAQTPQISNADLLRQLADPRGIPLANHWLEPLGAHQPTDKVGGKIAAAFLLLEESSSTGGAEQCHL